MGEYKRHSAGFKPKVVLEAFQGDKTVNELAALYQVHPRQIIKWRKRLLEEVPHVFEDGRAKGRRSSDEVLQAQLYQEIGRLKVELDFLKKKTGHLG